MPAWRETRLERFSRRDRRGRQPVLIEKVRVVVTDDQGAYKIIDLRPGIYTVSFSLPGFSTFRREELELTTGLTAVVNGEMKVGALEETVTVTGASPVVDVQNVRQQTVFNREVQEALPLGRNVAQWATVLPGATVGGGGQPGQDVGGTAGKATYIGMRCIAPGGSMGLLQDGMTYRTAETAGFGLIANQAGTQETQLQTSGVGAEISYGAVQMNVVPREGANTWSLFSSGAFSNGSLQSDNITDELKARGAAGAGDLRTLYLMNVGVGGRIVRDRLWFYTAHQRSRQSKYQPGNYFNATQNTLFYTPDLNRQAITLRHVVGSPAAAHMAGDAEEQDQLPRVQGRQLPVLFPVRRDDLARSGGPDRSAQPVLPGDLDPPAHQPPAVRGRHDSQPVRRRAAAPAGRDR